MRLETTCTSRELPRSRCVSSLLSLFAWFALTVGSSAHSAEVTQNEICAAGQETCINVTGEIVEGDAQKILLLIYRATQRDRYPIRITVDSTGGDLVEAMKIGRFIRQWFINTTASSFPNIESMCYGDDCACYSACFFIWVSGISRTPGMETLGIHRPKFDDKYFAGLSATEAVEKYDELRNESEEFLAYMGVPDQLIAKMFAVPSSQIYVLADSEIQDLLGYGEETYPAPVAEWLSSKCGDFSPEEDSDLVLLNNNFNRSATEDRYRKMLLDKAVGIGMCKYNAIADEQRSRLEEFIAKL